MFIVASGGLLAIIGIIVLFFPPDFEEWDKCKLYLLTNNPLKWAIGFVFCTMYALQFIVWYLVFYQLLRFLVFITPFAFVYFFIRALFFRS